MKHQAPDISEDEVNKMFDEADKDRSGYIDYNGNKFLFIKIKTTLAP